VTGTESTGGFVGHINYGGMEISDCRADGFTSGGAKVGGFVGSIGKSSNNSGNNSGNSSNNSGNSGTVSISNCVARGDVRSAGSGYGGFVGRFAHASATIDGCWSSGAVWGTGGDIGSFVGNLQSGTIANCAASAYANGLRLFCGNSTTITGGRLSLSEVHARSAGWPSVPKRANSASMTPIATVEDFLAITNDLAGRYVLVADIDFEGAAIEPIGGSSAAFTGELYGQGHRILGFEVASDDRYAGLFGKIAGGRVSSVAVEGVVDGSYGNESATDVGVGGFAGKIDSKSLVEGCSFDGEVANETTCNAGGFVGYTTDSPVILRCRAWGNVDNFSGKSDTGGFVGNHSGGSITDCCALMECAATDNGDASAGGFAGLVASARIANSWCSGCVDSRGGYVGAFVGKANTGLVTDSYYDTSANNGMGAVGKNSGGSTTYTGITPIVPEEKYNAASYPSFDFTNTWSIAEGVDEPRLVPLTAFTDFLDSCYLPLNTKPDADVNGIPAGARYVFGIDPQTGPADLAEPLIDIGFDTAGNPSVKIPETVNTDGATVTVLATEDLADWSGAKLVPMAHDASDGTWKPAVVERPPRLFFKWRISFDW
jgi:hypothetical protein